MFGLKLSFWISSFVWLVLGLCPMDSWAQQVVFVDFDSATTGEDHVYTPSERQQILAAVERDFARFQFFFTDVEPTSGEFSTVIVNDGSGGLFVSSGFSLGGTDPVDGRDFRNLDMSDNGSVNVNFVASTSAEFVIRTANAVSRNVAELSGLRDFDSFGPIGSGVFDRSLDPSILFNSNNFSPAYPGPFAAFETPSHLLNVNPPFFEDDVDPFFSERSAIKLTFNEIGTAISEAPGEKGTLATAQDIVLAKMTVPNTIESGERENLGDFDVDALSISGSKDVGERADLYRFEAKAGSILNIEFVALGDFRAAFFVFDAEVTVLDESGNPINYFGEPANSDDSGFYNTPLLVDLVIPEDGVYFMQVSAPSVAKGRRVRENPDLTPEELFQQTVMTFVANGFTAPERSDFPDLFPEFSTGTYEVFVSLFNGEVASDSVGDFDDDGDVDIDDVDFYVGNIGSAAAGLLTQLDLNTDGQITIADLDIHLTDFVETSNGQTGTFPGDFDLDGLVSVLRDAFILIGNLGTSVSSYALGDANLDGTVNVLDDAFALIANLGNSNAP